MDLIKESDEIEGVIIQPLRQIIDNRGAILHMMRNDTKLYEKFGEVYFSEILTGKVKAWKMQTEKTQNLAVPVNKIRLVIYDSRSKSKTHGKIKEYEIYDLEISEFIKKRYKIEKMHQKIYSRKVAKKYDSILCIELLEHLKRPYNFLCP